MNQTVSTEPEFLNEAQAAFMTGMSTAWFKRARWAGDGPPFVKLGQAVRYRKTALLEWFAARERTSTTEASV